MGYRRVDAFVADEVNIVSSRTHKLLSRFNGAKYKMVVENEWFTGIHVDLQFEPTAVIRFIENGLYYNSNGPARCTIYLNGNESNKYQYTLAPDDRFVGLKQFANHYLFVHLRNYDEDKWVAEWIPKLLDFIKNNC